MKHKLVLAEFIIVFSLVTIWVLVFHFLFNLTNLRTDEMIECNIFDSSILLSKLEMLPLFVLNLVYMSYLLRWIFLGKMNLYGLVVFVILNLLIILILPNILVEIKYLENISGWTIYPPLSAIPNESKNSFLGTVYIYFYLYFIFVVIFGAFLFYKLRVEWSINNASKIN